VSEDRTYWNVPGWKWHALAPSQSTLPQSICGQMAPRQPETSDRVPSHGKLCGSCARIIAARTDIEG